MSERRVYLYIFGVIYLQFFGHLYILLLIFFSDSNTKIFWLRHWTRHTCIYKQGTCNKSCKCVRKHVHVYTMWPCMWLKALTYDNSANIASLSTAERPFSLYVKSIHQSFFIFSRFHRPYTLQLMYTPCVRLLVYIHHSYMYSPTNV